MAQSPVQRVYEILRHPYFLPVSLILPVTTYFLYSGLTTRKSATISPSKPHQCCFRLDDETSSTLTLPDGRQLGYAEYGSATGRPILAMHGTPGSRKEWAFWDEIGKKYDARFIGIDRPGFGLSSPQESRMVVDIAKDVQRLTEHLNLEEYAVIGCSGGGPPALACAHSLPADKLKGVAVLVGVGMPGMNMQGIGFMHWLGFSLRMLSHAPWLARTFWRRDVLSQTQLDDKDWLDRLRTAIFGGSAHAKDAELVLRKGPEWRDDLLRVLVGSMREAFANGVNAVADDGRAMTSDWGLEIEEICPDLPIQLWYGKYDTFVPSVIGSQIAERFRGKAELHIEDESHGSLQWNHQERILKDLLRAAFKG